MWNRLAAPMFALLAGCGPKYAHLGPVEPAQLWSPLPVQHVDVNGVDVAYVDSGGDGPVLLMVHGLSSYLSFWEYQIPHYQEQGYRVVALDLPGYGRSGRPDAPYTPPWFAEVVLGFLDAKGFDQVALMAHSMGGQISMTLALAHPERLSALVLSAPAGIERFTPGEARFLSGFWTEDRALHTTEEELRYTFTKVVFARTDAGVERLLEERVRMQSTAAFRGTSVAVSRSIAGMVEHPVVDRLGELRVPTLIVYGTDDRMIPNPVLHGGRTTQIAKEAGRAIPGATVVTVPGGGHTVHHDDPTAFHAAADPFLAAHASASPWK